ncbi:MAG: glycosyltransferase family 87 protein [Actinomycetota bacterium]
MVHVATERLRPRLSKWFAPYFALDDVGRDVVLYALSACFALVIAYTSTLALYREWGAMAAPGYLLAMVLSVVVFKNRHRLGVRPLFTIRSLLCGLVLFGTLIVPLGIEVAWRTTTPNPYLHVQPEVTGIERAGQAFAQNKDPYRVVVRDGHVRSEPGIQTFEEFFPYLPLMAAFGYVSSTTAPDPVTDARLTFLLVTLVVLIAAGCLAPMSKNRRLRVAQCLLVLPMGALPLVTGGDDLPVVALLFLGLVLTAREMDLPAGLISGIAAAMKFTAWPIALLAICFIGLRKSGREKWAMLAGFLAVLIPVVVPYAVLNPTAFIQNVVLFPLGLSGVPSPAASPLFGHLVVSLLPSFHRTYVVLIAVLGCVIFFRRLWNNPPRTSSAVATLAGWCALFAVVVAPSTRIGYVIYPISFFIWGECLPATKETSLDAAELVR